MVNIVFVTYLIGKEFNTHSSLYTFWYVLDMVYLRTLTHILCCVCEEVNTLSVLLGSIITGL